jgi:hypothetical protein
MAGQQRIVAKQACDNKISEALELMPEIAGHSTISGTDHGPGLLPGISLGARTLQASGPVYFICSCRAVNVRNRLL